MNLSKCAGDNFNCKMMMEKEHLFAFLAGLNKELDYVQGQVLGKEPPI